MTIENNYPLIDIEQEDYVTSISIKNPPLNVLHPTLATSLSSLCNKLENDLDTRVIILTGEGNTAFCAGFDIKVFPKYLHPSGGRELSTQLNDTLDLFANLSKPTIASINGVALGGGLELAMACDIRFAARSAVLGQPEIKLGIIPGAGGTQRLPRLIGSGRAKEMLFWGETIDSEEAQKIGLLNKVFDDEALKKQTLAAAHRLSGLSTSALHLIKQAVNEGLEKPLKAALNLEINLFEKALQNPDSREGVNAFTEKKKPRFNQAIPDA